MCKLRCTYCFESEICFTHTNLYFCVHVKTEIYFKTSHCICAFLCTWLVFVLCECTCFSFLFVCLFVCLSCKLTNHHLFFLCQYLFISWKHVVGISFHPLYVFIFFYNEAKRKIGKDQKWQAEKQQQGSIKQASTRILLIDLRFLRGAPDARLIRNKCSSTPARSFPPDKHIQGSFAVFYLSIDSTDAVHSSGRKSTPLLPSRPCA